MLHEDGMKIESGNVNKTETALPSHLVFLGAGKCTDVLCLQIFQENIFDGKSSGARVGNVPLGAC